MRMLVDTSAWLALADRKDQHHADAVELLERLKTQQTLLVLSEWLLAETLTVIRSRVHHAAAVRFGRVVLESHVAELIGSSDALRERAWAIFQQYEDKDFSFVDCTSFAIMERSGLKTAFAFDRHFEQYGFQLLSRVIR